jgi:hypothetical protein
MSSYTMRLRGPSKSMLESTCAVSVATFKCSIMLPLGAPITLPIRSAVFSQSSSHPVPSS